MKELSIKKISSVKGRGVFAERKFKKGEIIEVCPVISVFKWSDCPKELENYVFARGTGFSAFLGGYGSFYNHSKNPNAKIKKDFINKKVVFYLHSSNS